MSELDMPRAVLVNVHSVGYDVDMTRLFANEVGEQGVDERLHPTVM